jgi:hypothetical protein
MSKFANQSSHRYGGTGNMKMGLTNSSINSVLGEAIPVWDLLGLTENEYNEKYLQKQPEEQPAILDVSLNETTESYLPVTEEILQNVMKQQISEGNETTDPSDNLVNPEPNEIPKVKEQVETLEKKLKKTKKSKLTSWL